MQLCSESWYAQLLGGSSGNECDCDSHRLEQPEQAVKSSQRQRRPPGLSALAARSEDAGPSSRSQSGSIDASQPASSTAQPLAPTASPKAESTASLADATAGHTGVGQIGSAAGIVPAKWGSQQDLGNEGFLEAPTLSEWDSADQPGLKLGKSRDEPHQETGRSSRTAGEEPSNGAQEKETGPEAHVVRSAEEQSPRIPFGLATAGGSGMDFFDGKIFSFKIPSNQNSV